MKSIISTIVVLVFVGKTFATGQIPDYLIHDQDTVAIYNNPLEQYFEQTGKRELIDFNSPCWSTACWRGYVAYWELENDSLFLKKITSCIEDCSEDDKDANLFSMFGENRPFASWYTGTLTVPIGEVFYGSSMGYDAVYECEDKMQVDNGVLQSTYQISNNELIKQIKLENSLYSNITNLKDTLLVYLKDLDWEDHDEIISICRESYILSYDKSGQIRDVELILIQDESIPILYKPFAWLFDRKCSKKIKAVIKTLSLSYLNSHRDFEVELELSYSGPLEIGVCRPYIKPLSEKELEENVKKQMEIKE